MSLLGAGSGAPGQLELPHKPSRGGAPQSGVSQPALSQEEPLHLRAQVGPVRMLLLAQPWQEEERGRRAGCPPGLASGPCMTTHW